MRSVGSCEHSSEPSAFTQGQKFLDKLSVCQLFRKDFALWRDGQGSEYKDYCLLEWEAMWSNISEPKIQQNLCVYLFMNGVESHCRYVTHITVSVYRRWVCYFPWKGILCNIHHSITLQSKGICFNMGQNFCLYFFIKW